LLFFIIQFVLQGRTKKELKQTPITFKKEGAPPHPEKESDSLIINLDIADSGY